MHIVKLFAYNRILCINKLRSNNTYIFICSHKLIIIIIINPYFLAIILYCFKFIIINSKLFYFCFNMYVLKFERCKINLVLQIILLLYVEMCIWKHHSTVVWNHYNILFIYYFHINIHFYVQLKFLYFNNSESIHFWVCKFWIIENLYVGFSFVIHICLNPFIYWYTL